LGSKILSWAIVPARQEGGNMRISYIYDMTAIFNKGKKDGREQALAK